ncbi:hypothetical protein HJG60_011166 [Phyllostomus discolor]|uniref:Uncharacterized protein n=1 Tax=Phyllostomus discolor TaxID=89673 RepID=A0A834E540_9CHIR|nr:hypothetical protein HJG60_011166 [Phyllostomus discolor]
MNSPVRLGVSPAAASTPTGVFNQMFEALFPSAGILGCVVCLVPQLFLPVYLHVNVGPPSPQAAALLASCCLARPAPQSTASLGPPATALPRVLSAQLPISTPPTSVDECFFFNSLVVGLPYSSIFCQFWLFFVFKLLLSFYLCEEAQCVYLHLHLGQESGYTFQEVPICILSLTVGHSTPSILILLIIITKCPFLSI